ncbi:MAG: hypothetical protein OEN56_04565 [Gemmatimonadota bacterium]|nr:hypothetical protein [Gemmatimonadota bacterium]
MKLRRLAGLLALSGLLSACSDEGPVSGPGTLTATLTGPNGAEGAAVIALLGDGIGQITAVGGTEVFSRIGNGAAQVVLINEPGGELSFRVAVADTTQPPAVVVEQVAGPDDALRALGAYSVEFSR